MGRKIIQQVVNKISLSNNSKNTPEELLDIIQKQEKLINLYKEIIKKQDQIIEKLEKPDKKTLEDLYYKASQLF